MNDLSAIPTEDLLAEFARRTAGDLAHFVAGRAKRSEPMPRTVESGKVVVAVVAEKFAVSEADIMGERRTARLARARQVAMAGLWQAGFSVGEVGYFFGRTHGTVTLAIRRTGAHRPTDESPHGPRRTAPHVRSGDSPPPATDTRISPTPVLKRP